MFFFQFYCLPDNYEVIDSSLDDIKVNNFVNNFNSLLSTVNFVEIMSAKCFHTKTD